MDEIGPISASRLVWVEWTAWNLRNRTRADSGRPVLAPAPGTALLEFQQGIITGGLIVAVSLA
jgi:hypothetical protein